jgi:hypothetical protein
MTSDHDSAAVRAELIDHVQRSWDQLRATVDGLDDRQLDATGPDGGWSVKDHLVHLERWEAYLLTELEGRDGRPELGLAEGAESPGTDAINDGLQRQHAGTPAGEVRRTLANTHARAIEVLGTLDAGELEERLAWIAGNTHEHFDEHAGLIRSMVVSPTS